MSMDLSKYINLVKNHGYKGKIGVAKETIRGMCLSAKPGDIVLFRPYEVREDADTERQEYDRTHCSIEQPYSEEEIQKRIKEGNHLKTFATCVGVPLSMIEEIKFE